LKEDVEILFVDDEVEMRTIVKKYLSLIGYKVTTVDNGQKALNLMKAKDYWIVITDLMMPRMNGIEFLLAVKERYPGTEVVMITGYGAVDSAVEALKLGCYDYIQKPFQLERLKTIIERIIEEKHLRWENKLLKKKLKERYKYYDLVGVSLKMQEVYETIERISDTTSTILIQGESGTGKELIAKIIHQHSNRKEGPFIAVNCGAITAGLMESELFGHKKGSFSGAIRDKIGLFKAADKGTIFLDEVLEVPALLQVKLLRILQEKRLRPVGDTDEFEVDVRVIAATNGNPENAIKSGALREDLFYRLNVIRVMLPSLKERKEDIPLLANHFLHKYNERNKRMVTGVSEEVMDILLNYAWPGNVRQLENVIERALALGAHETIEGTDLPPEITKMQEKEKPSEEIFDLTQNEIKIIKRALLKTGNNKTVAAALLGINTATLYRKLKRFEIADNELQNAKK
jgi:DNA-binding NtrC family response regulator